MIMMMMMMMMMLLTFPNVCATDATDTILTGTTVFSSSGSSSDTR